MPHGYRQHISTAFQIAVYLCLACASYYLFRLEAYGLLQSDFPDHLSILVESVTANQYIPHPVFHLSVYYLSLLTGMNIADTAPLVLSAATVVTLFAGQKLLAEKSGPLQLFIALSTILATAVYLPFFSTAIETFSPNKWHNPTMILLKPMSLLAFYLFVHGHETVGSSKKILLISSSALLLLATATKPSFTIVFLPAIFIYQALFRRREYKQYPALLLYAAPSVLMLAYQYFMTYQSSSTTSYFHDRIILTFFGVMKLYSPNIIVSNLLLLAFPLILLVVARSRAAHNPYLVLAWLTTIVAFLQAAFFAEQQKFDQGAFGIGYVISLFLLYFFSVKEVFAWFRQGSSDITATGKGIVVGIYLLHLISGIYYISTLLGGV